VKELSNPPISLAEQIERIERALSVTEVARLLSLCRASVYRYIDAGIIPAIRIGTTLRVDPKALALCLRRRTLVPDIPRNLKACSRTTIRTQQQAIPHR